MDKTFERKMSARFIASVVAIGTLSFAGVVEETAMNVTFPALMKEFKEPTSLVQWITTAYMLVIAALIPASSWLKKRFRMKSLFSAAAVLFIIGTVMCMLAPNFWMIVAGRIVQGVGTAVALPLMFNVVIEQAPFENMGLMMGVATLITAMAPAIGPSVGGLLIETCGWHSIFAVLLPLLICALIIGMLTIRQSSQLEKSPLAIGQLALLTAASASLVFATTSASTDGWVSVPVISLLAAFACCLLLFGVVAYRSSNPLIDVRVFTRPAFAWSVLYVLLFQGIVLGLGYLLPNFAQVVQHANAFAAGCILLPGCAIGAIMAPFGGNFLDRFGATKPIFTGAMSQLIALVLYCALGLQANVTGLMLIYILIPIGQGLSMANSITNGLSYLPAELKADGNATLNTVQQLGGAVGTAITTSIVNAAQSSGTSFVAATTTGVRNAFLLLAGLSIAAFACTLAALAKGKREKRAQEVAVEVSEG